MKRRIVPIVFVVGICCTRNVQSKIEVYFSPQGGCERRTVQLLSKAKKQIDVAMYRLNNLTILGELEKAKARGVQIRILVDRVRALQNKQLLLTLKNKKFDLRVHTKNREQHNSYAVIDGTIVLSGSYDWYTMSELFNEENCLMIDDKEVAEKFAAHFDKHLWKTNSGFKSDDFFAYIESGYHRRSPRLNIEGTRVPASVNSEAATQHKN